MRFSGALWRFGRTPHDLFYHLLGVEGYGFGVYADIGQKGFDSKFVLVGCVQKPR